MREPYCRVNDLLRAAAAISARAANETTVLHAVMGSCGAYARRARARRRRRRQSPVYRFGRAMVTCYVRRGRLVARGVFPDSVTDDTRDGRSDRYGQVHVCDAAEEKTGQNR